MAGAWIGYDKPREIMPGGYAAKVALPIWTRVMQSAQSHYSMEPFPVPDGLQVVTLGGGWNSQGGERYYLTSDQQATLNQNPDMVNRGDQPHRNLFDRLLDIFR